MLWSPFYLEPLPPPPHPLIKKAGSAPIKLEVDQPETADKMWVCHTDPVVVASHHRYPQRVDIHY